MDVRLIREAAVRECLTDELPALLTVPDAVVWVDIPAGDPGAERVLTDLFGFHVQAVEDSGRRNPAPKLHVYPDHIFLVLHAPELGERGHIHYIELDVFLSSQYLVTVHGPLNPAVDPSLALVETAAVAARIDSGRWVPTSSYDLAHAVVTGLNRRMTQHVAKLTTDTWTLEREVTDGKLGNPELFLEEMFRVRHGLQAVQTMATLDHQVFGRLATLDALDGGKVLVSDALDQFERVRTMAQTQSDYLEGVITLYQTRANTKMTIAAERLAVIAAVTLPVTAISSVLGMNVIVSEHTNFLGLAILLTLMVGLSGWLLYWCKRQGWW